MASAPDFAFAPAWLFVPADRPDRYRKAADRADIVIVDLEDAVAQADKAAARQALAEHTAGTDPLDPARTIIRVNAVDSEHFAADLDLLAGLPFTHIMLPKAEIAAGPEAVADYQVIALIETARGAMNAGQVAACENVTALMWGAEDLIADLGGGSSRTAEGAYRDVARTVRSLTLLAAKAHGKRALDAIWAAIDDLDGLAAETHDAVESGFDGKVSIHPKHIAVVRDAFAPSEEQLRWAREVLRLAESSNGAFSYEGKMIDAPLLRHAQTIVSRAS